MNNYITVGISYHSTASMTLMQQRSQFKAASNMHAAAFPEQQIT